MATLTIEQLEKELHAKTLRSIYLLYGEELFLLESVLKRIKNNLGELIQGINYIQIDEKNVTELISDIETPAFGYEKKLIIVRDTGLLKKEGKKKNAKLNELKEKIAKYIEDNVSIINDSDVIVFIEENMEKGKLATAIEKNGVICSFERQKPADIQKRLKSICKAYKVNVDDATLRYFIECCGTNMQDLINEVRKLIEYEGENGTITKETIDLLAIKQIESVIFDLTDNLGKKQTKEALVVLKNLLDSKEPIQKILITLYNHFKKLYIVKLAEKYNRNLAEAMSLKPNQMFLVNKYKAQASLFNEKDLKKLINELIDLDTNYKQGLIDLNVGLEAILCRYCSK